MKIQFLDNSTSHSLSQFGIIPLNNFFVKVGSSTADTGHFVCSKMTYEEIEQNIHVVHGPITKVLYVSIVCTILSLSLSYPTYSTRIGRDTIFT